MLNLLRERSLNGLLTLPFIMLIAAAVFVVGSLSIGAAQAAADRTAESLWQEVAARVRLYLTTYMDTPAHLVRDTAELANTSVLDPGNSQRFLTYLSKQIAHHEEIWVSGIGRTDGSITAVGRDAEGGLVGMVSPPGTGRLKRRALYDDGQLGDAVSEAPFDVQSRPWFQLGISQAHTSWTMPYQDYDTGEDLISVVHPVTQSSGGPTIGVMSAGVSLSHLSAFLASIDAASVGQIFVVDRSGRRIASSTTDLDDPTWKETLAQLMGNAEPLATTGDAQTFRHHGGGDTLMVSVTPFAAAGGIDWLVITAVPRSTYLGWLQDSVRNTIMLGLAALVLAMLLGGKLARLVSLPLERLNEAAKRVAAGQFEERQARHYLAEVQPGGREVRELFASFAEMTGQLYRSIDQLRVLNSALTQSESQLRQVLETLPAGTLVHTPDLALVYANSRAKTLLGIAHTAVLDEPGTRERLHDSARASLSRIEEVATRPSLAGELVHVPMLDLQVHEAQVPVELWSAPVFDDTGQIAFAVASMQDISERRRSEQQLLHQAMHDELTGLPNRTQLTDRINAAIARGHRQGARSFALLFLDLDNFKVVNDSLGHLAGDDVLVEVAERLRSLTRSADLAVRLGGDEFVLLLDELKEDDDALQVADRIFEQMREPIRVGPREVSIGTSIGVVFGSSAYDDASELLRDADIAVYRAKSDGRGRHAVFDDSMREKAMRRQELEEELRRAIQNDGLSLAYQPIVSLADGRPIGFEALCRWRHERFGAVPPTEFIAIAEDASMIVNLDRWVLRTACAQLALWQTQNPLAGELRVSINLSSDDLARADTADFILNTLDEHGLTPSNLTLELTEGVLIENIAEAIETLAELRARGLRVSIDDFGTGYSSLSYLYNLPVDALKIDKVFVSAMEGRGTNQKIVNAVVTLSNELGINAVAEGIENEAQLSMLRAIECELGQGYLFSKPLPPDQVLDWLMDRSPRASDRSHA